MTISPLPGDPAGAVMTAAAQVLAGLEQLVAAPWWQLSAEQLTQVVCAMHLAENRAAAVQVAALGEGVARGAGAEAGHASGAAWLRALVPVTPQSARTRALLAEELPRPDLAPVREAFAAGQLGAGQAGVVVRTMTALDDVPEVDPVTWAEAQHLMVAAGQQLDTAQLGRVGARVRTRLCPDGAERLAHDEEAMERLRSAYLVQESTGMWLLRAVLTPTGGAAVRAALDPLCAPQPTSEFGADARTGMQRTADGLVALAELSLAQSAGQPGGLPVRHGSPTRLVVTGDLAALAADLTRRGGAVGLAPPVLDTGEPGGTEVSPLTFQTQACDAEVVPMLLDDTGRPLDVGESQYRFPRRIRLAIEARDRHCTFDGCAAPPAWCQTHHLVAFGRDGRPGGRTSEDNGTLLCGRHHRFVHRAGWVGRIVDGHVRWRPPRPGEPSEHGTARVQAVDQALRRLARAWLARHPELRDTS